MILKFYPEVTITKCLRIFCVLKKITCIAHSSSLFIQHFIILHICLYLLLIIYFVLLLFLLILDIRLLVIYFEINNEKPIFMRKFSIVQQFALLLLLILTLDSASGVTYFKCPGDLYELDCRCLLAKEKMNVDVICNLGEDLSISGLFQRISNNHNYTIHKLTISSCKSSTEVLQPLPQLKVFYFNF